MRAVGAQWKAPQFGSARACSRIILQSVWPVHRNSLIPMAQCMAMEACSNRKLPVPGWIADRRRWLDSHTNCAQQIAYRVVNCFAII